MTKQLSSVNVGVDVSKDKLDVHLLERGLSLSIPNHEQQIKPLINRLARYRLERIVIEATGRLEHAFVSAAIARGLPIVVVSPLKVRRFAEAVGQLAKTDAIDAHLIARFAAALKPAARPVIDPNSQLVKDLVVRRRQLTSLRTTEKNRRGVMPEALKTQHRPHHRVSGSGNRFARAAHSERRRSTRRLATQMRSPHFAAWRRRYRRKHLNRGSARARRTLSPTNRRAHRCRSLQPRQRRLPRQTPHSWRSRSFTHRALSQRHGRDPAQPRHQTLLRTSASSRQAQEGRSHCLHPQNRHRSQRHASRQQALAAFLRLTRDHSRLLGAWHIVSQEQPDWACAAASGLRTLGSDRSGL